MWFQKISIPQPKRAIGNFEGEVGGGGGDSKAKIFKGKHEPKLEIPERPAEGSNQATLHGGSMAGCFL